MKFAVWLISVWVGQSTHHGFPLGRWVRLNGDGLPMEQLRSTYKTWVRLCEDPHTQPDLLAKGVYWESIALPRKHGIRLRAARHPRADGRLLGLLTHGTYLPLLIAVAEHPRLTERTAGRLLRKQFRQLRLSLAGNPFIPVKVMERLARDHEPVRRVLAGNPKLVPSVMETLAKVPVLHPILARNPALSGKALRLLLHSPDAEVRLALIRHPNLRERHLLKLLDDPSLYLPLLRRAARDFPQAVSLFQKLSRCAEKKTAALAGRLYQKALQMKKTAPRREPVMGPRGRFTMISERDVLLRLQAAQDETLTQSFNTDEIRWEGTAEPVAEDRQLAQARAHTLCLGPCEPGKADRVKQVALAVKQGLVPCEGVRDVAFFRVRQRDPRAAAPYQVFVVFCCEPGVLMRAVTLVRRATRAYGNGARL